MTPRPFRWPLSSSCHGGAKPPPELVKEALRRMPNRPPRRTPKPQPGSVAREAS